MGQFTMLSKVRTIAAISLSSTHAWNWVSSWLGRHSYIVLLVFWASNGFASGSEVRQHLIALFYELENQEVEVEGCWVRATHTVVSSSLGKEVTLERYINLRTLDYDKMGPVAKSQGGPDFVLTIPSYGSRDAIPDILEMGEKLKEEFPESNWPRDAIPKYQSDKSSVYSEFLLRNYPEINNMNRLLIETNLGYGIWLEPVVFIYYSSRAELERLSTLIQEYAAAHGCIQ